MISNTDLTIINVIDNRGASIYQKTVIKNVFFQEKQAINRVKSGFQDSDKVLVLIPFSNKAEREYISPKQFKSSKEKEQYYTFKEGDYISREKINEEINSGNFTEIDKVYDLYKITSVDKNDFGRSHMQHWKIGGK